MRRLSDLFSPNLQPLRLRLAGVVQSLQEQALALRQQALAQSLSDFRESVHEPFLFVIVGEVKTGKSSFINALLATGTEVVAVAPDPCTDTIQQVMYGQQREEIVINPYLKKILMPVEILKDISIVDTPGTNTISEHHQEITERYIPRADLVVFVFEAKNPYRQSAWDFFRFIHQDWHKKIVFVLQQADLMEPADLEVNIQGLRRHAEKQGITAPVVFALSAKQELAGLEQSGFGPLREYIRENITGLDAGLLKLRSNLDSCRQYHRKLGEHLQLMQETLVADRAFRREVSLALEEQAQRSNKQIEQLVERIISDYDKITGQGKEQLGKELGVLPLLGKSFRAMISKSASPQATMQAFSAELEQTLKASFTQRIHDGMEEIADSIRQMAQIIDLKIKTNGGLARPQSDVFGDISDKRKLVLQELKENFGEFMGRAESFVGREVFPEAAAFTPNVAAGSGMAVIGVVLATVSTLPALDITGGLISALGVLFAGGTIVLKRGSILKGYRDEIARGRDLLAQALDSKLKAYVAHIRSKIEGNFAEFDQLLQAQQVFAEEQAGQSAAIAESMDQLRKKLG